MILYFEIKMYTILRPVFKFFALKKRTPASHTTGLLCVCELALICCVLHTHTHTHTHTRELTRCSSSSAWGVTLGARL